MTRLRYLAQWTNLALAVPDVGNTTLLELTDIPEEATRLEIEITNTGNALDAFILSRKGHPDGSYDLIADAAADFTTPALPLLEVSSDMAASLDLTTLEDGKKGWVKIAVDGEASWKIEASGNGATVMSIYVIAR